MTKTPRDLFDRLQELPAELYAAGGKLGYSPFEPAITVQIDNPAPPKRPEGVALIPNKSSHSIRLYYVQVIYPKLWCYPTADPVAVEALRLEQNDEGLKQGVRDRGALARSRLYYKLTKLDGRELSPFYVCRVHYGPWLAQVREEESCFIGVPSRWTLEALGGEIALVWDGEWADIPSLPNLQVIMSDLHLYDTEFACCPGYQWCNGGCRPIELGCAPVVPI